MADHLCNTIAEALGEPGYSITGVVEMHSGIEVEFRLQVLAVKDRDGTIKRLNEIIEVPLSTGDGDQNG